jgi:YVTN family beta-propeller protein
MRTNAMKIQTAIGLIAALSLSAGALAKDVAVILNSGENSISLVDRLRYEEIERVTVGREPHHLMATPDDKYLIVAESASNDLLFLDPKTGAIKRRLENISDPYQIGFSPNKKFFVAASLRLDRVDIYGGSPFHVLKHIEAPKMPSHLAFDRDSRLVFVTLQGSDEIAAIDLETQEMKWKLPVGRQPAGILMTSDDQYLLVGIMGEDNVAVIDWRAQKIVKKIVTAKGAHNFLPMGDGRRVLVSNRVANTISIIDYKNLTVLESFAAPGGPDCMELSKDGKELWVTSRWIKRVNVIDMATKQVIHSIPVGKSPHGVYFFDHAERR